MRLPYRLYDIYHARPEDCAECPVRARCLSKPTTLYRYLSVQVEEPEPNVLDEMKAKIDSPECKKIYARRLAIVEPVFANMCVHKRQPIHAAHEIECECAVEVVCDGPQYRENRRIWGAVGGKKQ